MNRNEKSPWNPKESLNITWKEFELKVVDWLKKSSEGLTDFEVKHLEKVEGNSGEYELDAVAKLSILNGAEIIVAVECKRYSKPVGRDKVMILHTKANDIGAHKSMMFSTSGFQRGAIEYASANNIALLVPVDEGFLYETKSMEEIEKPITNVITGIYMTATDEGSISCQAIEDNVVECIREWLNESKSKV